MAPLDYLSLAFPLGLAGFDPAPALIATLYLAHHSSRHTRRNIYLFGLLLVLGTATWGLLLTALVGSRIQHIPWHQMIHWLLHAGAMTVLLKVGVGVALLSYGIYAWRKKSRSTAPSSQEKSSAGLFTFAFLFIAIVTTDVPFTAYVGISGGQPFLLRVPAFLLWSTLALLPLPALLLTMLLGKDSWFTAVLQKFQKRLTRLLSWGIPAVCLCLGISLLLDGAVAGVLYLVQG